MVQYIWYIGSTALSFFWGMLCVSFFLWASAFLLNCLFGFMRTNWGFPWWEYIKKANLMKVNIQAPVFCRIQLGMCLTVGLTRELDLLRIRIGWSRTLCLEFGWVVLAGFVCKEHQISTLMLVKRWCVRSDGPQFPDVDTRLCFLKGTLLIFLKHVQDLAENGLDSDEEFMRPEGMQPLLAPSASPFGLPWLTPWSTPSAARNAEGATSVWLNATRRLSHKANDSMTSQWNLVTGKEGKRIIWSFSVWKSDEIDQI